jgi:hypothetical protein
MLVWDARAGLHNCNGHDKREAKKVELVLVAVVAFGANYI